MSLTEKKRKKKLFKLKNKFWWLILYFSRISKSQKINIISFCFRNAQQIITNTECSQTEEFNDRSYQLNQCEVKQHLQ